ncbi:MAG: site-specific integrase [Clostridia bacterium]|nr:site-specific integrase [Clostridia bacterium]
MKASWKAYYENEELSQDIINKPLNKITRLELREWAESLMKKHEPDKKKFCRMFEIVNQVMEYAADEDRNIITENLWTKAKKKINKDLLVSKPMPTDESQVFTGDERRKLKIMIHEDLERYEKQSSSAGLQILFLFETGLRIGECCGLKWTDVKNGRLYIQRQANNEGVKEWTKTTAGYRDIPLTKAALRILDEVIRFNEEHDFTAEWIFQSSNPKYDYRLSYNAADRKLRKLCNRLDSIEKSPHKCRKTCISTLLDNPNVNNKTVQRFAGHRDFTTTNAYYNFDRKDKEAQAEAISMALAV